MEEMKNLNINIKKDIHRRVKVACAEAGLTVRGWVREAIVEHLRRHYESKKAAVAPAQEAQAS